MNTSTIKNLKLSVKIFLLILCSTFSISLLSGCILLPEEEKVLAPPLKAVTQITYDTIEAKKGSIEKKIECTGHFVSIDQRDLSFTQKGGKLKAIYVKAGDEVKAGTLLAELDTGNSENELKKERIILKASEENYDQAKKTSQLGIQLEKEKLDSSKKEYERAKAIAGTYSVKEIEDMESQNRQQELSIKKSEEDYNQTEINLRKEMELSRLNVQELEAELAGSKMMAPVSGILDYVDPIKTGENIDAFQTIIRMADPSKLLIEYSDDNVSYFNLGMKVKIKINSEEYTGTVVMEPGSAPVDAKAEQKSSIRISVEGLPAGIAIGDSANIVVTLQKKDDILVVPKSVVANYNGRRYVEILEKGIRKQRDIEIGIETATELEIVKGLNVGDKLIER